MQSISVHQVIIIKEGSFTPLYTDVSRDRKKTRCHCDCKRCKVMSPLCHEGPWIDNNDCQSTFRDSALEPTQEGAELDSSRVRIYASTSSRRCHIRRNQEAKLNAQAMTSNRRSQRCANQQLQFSAVHIRGYDVIIGDHPGCTDGLSLAIGWNYNQEWSQTLDQYELSRRGRRSGKDLKLNSKERWCKLVTDGGYTERELFLERRKMLLKERAVFFLL